MQLSVTARNARLDAIETAIGTAPKMQFFTGAAPANCATADSGTKLVDSALPSDWLTNAASGTKGKNGSWNLVGVAAGNAGHFRVKDSAGTTCHIQGSITATGGGGDMTLDNINIAVDQAAAVNSFNITDGNA
jgi:hypothetical protein